MLRQSKKPLDHATAANGGELGHVLRLLVKKVSRINQYRRLSTRNGWLGDGVLMAAQWIQRLHLFGGAAPARA